MTTEKEEKKSPSDQVRGGFKRYASDPGDLKVAPTLAEYVSAGYHADTYKKFFGFDPPEEKSEEPTPQPEPETLTPSPPARRERKVPSFSYPGYQERKK